MISSKIYEQLQSSDIGNLEFFFSDNQSVIIKDILFSESDDQFIHVTEPNELVINLNNVLYYEIHELTNHNHHYHASE
ncbi:hypothetical protein [Staphylococcus casei]|uniref:Uncharacterized protein n=1 Tax=Staphylococcus casei TaxID=201828 RepID=A0ABZ2WBR3_9STAP